MSFSKPSACKAHAKKALSFAVAAMNATNVLVPVAVPYIHIAKTVQHDIAHSQVSKATVDSMHLGVQFLDQLVFTKAEAFTSPVENGEIIHEEIVSAGTQHILSGGTTLKGTIKTGGIQLISAGGLATSTTINQQGEQHVSDSGIAQDTTVNFYGTQLVASGGSALNTTVNSGGWQTVADGGTALNVIQNNGGNIVANVVAGNNIQISGTNEKGKFSLANGTASNFIIYQGGWQHIANGGLALATTLGSGGWQLVSQGGTGLDTTIHSSGDQWLTSGGTTSNTTIQAGGAQLILYGGTALDTTVSSGGSQWLQGGGTALNTVQMSGAHIITSVFAGDLATVTGTNEKGTFSLANGTASNFVLYNGGWQTVSNGGSSLDILQYSGGNIHTNVQAGDTTKITGTNENGAFSLSNGIASNFALYSGGGQWLQGGIASNTNIHSGGWQYVNNGGTALDTTIHSGAVHGVTEGGTSLNAAQNIGGKLDVSIAAGATTSVTGTNEKGTFSLANGTASNFIVYNGGEHWVSAGGTSLNLTQSSGGRVTASVAAGASTKIVGTNEKGEFSLSNGTANNFIVYSGGRHIVSHGGTSLNLIQSSGGDVAVEIAAGNNIQISGTNEKGAFSLVNGTANNFILYNQGWQQVNNGGSAVNTTINKDGWQDIGMDGTAISTTLNGGGQNINAGTALETNINGGVQWVNYGGSALDTTIQANGQQVIGGTAIRTGINDKGHQFVRANGQALVTSINQGGQQTISATGSAISTTINSGGTQNIVGGNAVSTTINNGGIQFVHDGANAIDTVVNSGALMYGQSNGTLTDTTLNSGGTLVLFRGAKVLGSLDNRGYIDASKFNNGSINALSGTGGTVLFNAAPYVPVTYGKSLSLGSLDGSQTFDISADLKNNTADNIVITGDVSGTHYIKVTKEASPGSALAALVGPTTVATVLGTDTSQFLGAQSAIDGVKILPNIVHNGNLWQIDRYTITGVSDLAKVAAASADMAYAALHSSDQTLKTRTGDIKDSLKESGVWVKLNGGEIAVNNNTMKHASFQGGYDKVHTGASGSSITGIMLEHLDGSVGYLSNGSGKLRNTRVGLYHTWFGNSGQYYDIVLKTGSMRNEITVHESSLVKGNYSSWNSSISLEYGHKKLLKNGYYINPFAKLSLGRINNASYTTNSDTLIQQDGINSVLGKVGIGIGHNTERSKWYINAALAHEFTAKSKVTTGQGAFASTIENSLRATALEVSLGTSVKVSHSGLFYTNLSKSFGGKVINKWQLQAGYRYNF